MMLAPKVTSATGRTPHDSKGRKQGPRGRKPASAIARRRLRRCCGDRDEQTLRHGDEDGWPPRYRASGNRTQRPQGGEVLNDQDVAPKTMGIIVVVSPLWFNDSQAIAAAKIWPSQLLAWVRTKVLTISKASFWYSGDSDRKYLRI